MPKMHANMATSRTTRRFLKQTATNWSIIEAHRTFDDYSLTWAKSGFDRSGRTLLIGDFDGPAFEGPIRDFDEDARLVVGHQERRGWHDQPRRHRRAEARVRKHARLQTLVRIIEGNPDLGAPRIGFEHVADEQNLACENLARIGRERNRNRLIARHD